MKTRNGFVSNSSSSSFIISRGNIDRVAISMLTTVISDWNDEESTDTNKKRYKQWEKNLLVGLERADVKSGQIGLLLPSCNYETYIFKKNGDIYVSTSNNHSWDREGMGDVTYRDVGADDGHDDRVHQEIEGLNYFNIKNRLIHSRLAYLNDSKQNRLCPFCKKDYGEYARYNNKNLCGGCFKGILGTQEIIEWTYEDKEKEEAERIKLIHEKTLKNMHPTKFLEI